MSELGALSGEKLAWWADLSEARGTNAVTRLKSYLDLRAPDRFLHLAFTGHRGCGKSAEFLRLTQHWERDFLVVYFPVTELLDPNDIAFSDLFLAISMQVAQACHDAGMPLDPGLLANVENFAATVIKESTQATDAEIAAGARVEAGGAIPFFAKLSILEYHGDRRWNYVHPLVRRIDRFSEALRERRPSAEGRPA